jgi:hypothetical protein
MSHHHQWLYLRGGNGAVEVFNGARLAAYLRNTDLTTGFHIADVLDYGGCESYEYAPVCGDFGDPVTWELISKEDPTFDPAPWYDPSRPESADGIGFWVEEWTGLDGSHISRPTSAAGPFNTALGRIGAGGRVMSLNVLVLAMNEPAMEYMYRWLESLLLSYCSSCATDYAYIRRYCPPSAVDPSEGVVELRNLGLVGPMKWEAPPVEALGCTMRRLSFTLMAGDPCMYTLGGDTVTPVSLANMVNCLANSTVSTLRSPCRPTCRELPSTCRTIVSFEVDALGAAAPTITFNNDSDDWSMPMRATVYSDENGVGVLPNPCSLPRAGQLYIDPLPPWSELVWDVVGRTVRYIDSSTGDFVPGWPYVRANDAPLRMDFALPCGDAHVVLEPASLCLSVDGSASVYGGLNLSASPHYPTTSLVMHERFGCP